MQGSLPAGWLTFAGRELNPLDRDERFQNFTPLLSFPCRKGWLPPTTRAALTGLRKRGFGIDRRKAKDERAGSYVIVDHPNAPER